MLCRSLGKKSPLSIKMAGEIGVIIKNEQPHLILNYFEFICDDNRMIDETVRLMTKYNLLSNDALIVSICILNKIKNIASFNKVDLTKVCMEEGYYAYWFCRRFKYFI